MYKSYDDSSVRHDFRKAQSAGKSRAFKIKTLRLCTAIERNAKEVRVNEKDTYGAFVIFNHESLASGAWRITSIQRALSFEKCFSTLFDSVGSTQ